MQPSVRSHYRVLLLACTVALAAAQQWRAYNFDETKVGSYTLPDPLVTAGGKPVRTATEWQTARRPELLQLFEERMFGKTPAGHTAAEVQVMSEPVQFGAVKAVRRQVTLALGGAGGPRLHLLLYLPAVHGPTPVFLGLNFSGNHTVAADPGIALHDTWVRDPNAGARLVRRMPDKSSRGSNASAWQVEKLLSRGYGLATVYYGDIEPDFDGGLPYGVRALFLKPGQTSFGDDEWGALAAWGWGLSRAMDYLSADTAVDARRVALMGHSRLGKAALWASALDPRFALVISNESGEGGAALSRRDYGETIEHLNVVFPHWYCRNYRQYNGHPEQLPFDSHELLALTAPRPLYVASAEGDQGSDPKGEFLGALHAGPVYRLFGKQGLDTETMPPPHQPILHTVGYHLRAGKHDVTEYDWEQYLRFADLHLGTPAAAVRSQP